MTTALTDPLLGRVLDGRYRIVSQIARGGMATVYEAVDTRLDRVVAVKSMHAGLVGDDDFVARFIREARSAARLSHPNVVAVFDQGTAGDPWSPHRVVYLVMELVRGRTLRQVLRERGPLPPTDALAVAEPVLAALRAAHEAQIVHRDVKPENVLLADDGRVKVADFGLARALSGDSAHTRTSGLLLGTVSYLAPEQVLDAGTDARADVYAAGIVLFEMLTGTKPFEGGSPLQIAWKHVNEQVPAPSTRHAGIPPAIDRLVLRATDRDPDGRFVDGRDFLAAVRAVSADLVTGRLEPARPATHEWPTATPARPAAHESSAGYESAAAEATVVARTGAPLPGPSRRVDPAPLPAERTEPTPRPAERIEPTPRPAERMDPATEPSRRLGGARPMSTTRPGRRRTRTGRADRAGSRTPTLAEQRARHALLSRRRRRRGVVALLFVVVLTVAIAVSAWWFGAGRFTSVPQLTGASETAARARLTGANLRMRVGASRFDAAVPAGYVLATQQTPNARVERGGTVTVVVSRGTERVGVPSLIGTTEQAARAALTAAGLSVGTVGTVDSDSQPAGQVASATPSPGQSLPVGGVVDLTVSRGPKPVDNPAVVGRPVADAAAAIRSAGLPVLVVTRPSVTVPAGRVTTQTPEPGPVPAHTTVTLSVSSGRPVVTVPPDLRGLDAATAAKRLTALGFVVSVRRAPQWVGLDQVWGVAPGGAARVPFGTAVALTVI